MGAQYLGHMISVDQSEASINVTEDGGDIPRVSEDKLRPLWPQLEPEVIQVIRTRALIVDILDLEAASTTDQEREHCNWGQNQGKCKVNAHHCF